MDIDGKTWELIKTKLPWLGYETPDDFVDDAIRRRLEDLLRLISAQEVKI